MYSLNDTSTHKQERLVEKQSSNVASTYMYRGRAALERGQLRLTLLFYGPGFLSGKVDRSGQLKFSLMSF